jgi:hypothetical protein
MYEERIDFSASASVSPANSYSVMVLHSLIVVLSTPYGFVTESVVTEPTEIERWIDCSSIDLKELKWRLYWNSPGDMLQVARRKYGNHGSPSPVETRPEHLPETSVRRFYQAHFSK